jgi:hypothetical protein
MNLAGNKVEIGLNLIKLVSEGHLNIWSFEMSSFLHQSNSARVVTSAASIQGNSNLCKIQLAYSSTEHNPYVSWEWL